VGAIYDDTGAANSGRVYLFDGATGALLLTIDNPVPSSDARFGTSVASLSNGNIVVGAPRAEVGAIDDVGSVYVFDAVTGALVHTLTPPRYWYYEWAGETLSVTADDRILVGAPARHVDIAGTEVGDAGAVEVFDGMSGAHLFTIDNPF